MSKTKRLAGELYAAGRSAEEIAKTVGETPMTVTRWAVDEGWVEARDLAAARAAAETLKLDVAAGKQFVALSEAIASLAAQVATKAKSKGVTAKDVLDLARATELAQKIRAATRQKRE